MHGYLSSSKSFILQSQFFKQYFNVYIPDLKGFGENADMPFPYSLDDYVNEVKDYIKENGLNRPHVIAHSFGGRIVLKMLYRDNAVFDKVVLTDTAGLKPKTTAKKFFKQTAFKVLKRFVKREKLLKFYSADYKALNSTMKESFKLIVGEHLDYTLKDIHNQTLIIFGKEDKDTPLYMAKKLRKNLDNSKLLILDKAGHFSFLDKPLQFNLEVREFLLS